MVRKTKANLEDENKRLKGEIIELSGILSEARNNSSKWITGLLLYGLAASAFIVLLIFP